MAEVNISATIKFNSKELAALSKILGSISRNQARELGLDEDEINEIGTIYIAICDCIRSIDGKQ